MARYHDSGIICKAHKRACPLGLSDGEHIEADSQEEFEEKLAAKMRDYGSSATMDNTTLFQGAPKARPPRTTVPSSGAPVVH